ncbi:PIN domain-containing protein [Candidatus Poribacteria bacterium]|nr:PIN domain-containing protein [Candidatus Poribacteria bacterium]
MNDKNEKETWFSYRLCFTDTSFFYALVDRSDTFHFVCKKLLQQAEKQRNRILTTNFIVAESHALILSRLGRSIAYQWLESVIEYAWIERITEDDEVKTRRILRDYNDKDFSYTDAASFVVMERLNVHIAFALDEHFVQYGGFLVLPLHGEQLLE